ncbi:unnamed protein product [Paramecium octaurelia]|uniref:Uncharacterized protein n=1 Tax=Paramecium octaurelia TaxID=43137 RepID=A0A8S1W4T4_PAROT|nr:unnamed protein product [Paramecium octaurelia]
MAIRYDFYHLKMISFIVVIDWEKWRVDLQLFNLEELCSLSGYIMEVSEICTIRDLRPLKVQGHRMKFIDMNLSRSAQENGYIFDRLRFSRFCFINWDVSPNSKKQLRDQKRNSAIKAYF